MEPGAQANEETGLRLGERIQGWDVVSLCNVDFVSLV
jgi:hypothetical protein